MPSLCTNRNISALFLGVVWLLFEGQQVLAQSPAYKVDIRFGRMDTTCYPSCAHPSEWWLQVYAEIRDSTNALIETTDTLVFNWGVDYCLGYGIQFGWTQGAGLDSIGIDGNKQKSVPGCCEDCPYQTYMIAVLVMIEDQAYESPPIRVPDAYHQGWAQPAPPVPNPFHLSSSSRLQLILTGDSSPAGTVFVYSASMDLVFTAQYPIVESFGNRILVVPTRDLRVSASSGVHFVIVKTNQKEWRWKLAIVE